MARRPFALLAGIALVSLAALGAWQLLAQRSRDNARIKELQTQVGRVQEELSSLRDRGPQVIYLNRRDEDARVAPFATAPDAASLSDAPPTPEATQPVTREAAQKAQAKFAAALDRRLLAEAPDSRWANPTLGDIHRAVREHAVGSRLVEARCAATLCRVVLEQASGKARGDAEDDLANAAPFDQGTYYFHGEETGGGRTTTTLYVVREGYDVKNEAEEARR